MILFLKVMGSLKTLLFSYFFGNAFLKRFFSEVICLSYLRVWTGFM